MSIRVIEGGMLTTVQDLGRFGFQGKGISAAGPMDSRSFRIANLLVGNDENAAGLEATILGPRLEFTEDTVLAVTGGDLQPILNGDPLPLYRAVAVHAGDELRFRGVRTGCRCYLAFAGGIDVPEVMGSRSTLLRAKLGGYEGRRLQKGDELKLFPAEPLPHPEARQLPPEDFSAREITLRVIMGPQDDRFTEKGIETFLSTPYRVTEQADRMGIRLSGETIEHVTDGNIITDGIVFGAVQVPSAGQPIIMAAERQPTGGYTKIASVCSADMPLLAQRKPGDTIRFEKIDVDAAQELYLAERARFEELRKALEAAVAEADAAPAKPAEEQPAKAAAVPAVETVKADRRAAEYRITLDGRTYAVTLEEID